MGVIVAKPIGRANIAQTGPGDPNASYVVLALTGSLAAERVLTAGTGVLIVDGGPEGPVTVNIDNSVVATLTGSIFSGDVIFQGGLSGSLQQLSDGTSYLLAGDNITITSSSAGAVTISSTATGGAGGDPDASYLVLSTTASLSNERDFTPGTGLSATDAGADSTYTLSINDSVVATVSGTTFTGDVSVPNLFSSGVVTASLGLSGSLTRLVDGTSYLTAGDNITIASASNGAITIASTAAAGTMSAFTASADTGTPQTIKDGNTLLLSGGTGIDTRAEATDTVVFDIDDSVTATISGSTFTGPVIFSQGLSGSLTRLIDGASYLIAGNNISITSASNGQIIIATSAVTAPTKQYYTVTSSIHTANIDVELGFAVNQALFKEDTVNIYLNGVLIRSGSAHDVNLGSTATSLQFNFALREDDLLTVQTFGT